MEEREAQIVSDSIATKPWISFR